MLFENNLFHSIKIPSFEEKQHLNLPFVVETAEKRFQVFVRPLHEDGKRYYTNFNEPVLPIDEGYSLGCVSKATYLESIGSRTYYRIPRSERREFEDYLQQLQQ